jgi:hypothetical protein
MAPKKNKTVAKKTAASTKKAVKAPKPTVTKSTATDEVIKRYKTAKNPAVEQLLQKYSPISTPIKRDLLIG